MSPAVDPRARLAHIDCLRAVAVVLVMIPHLLNAVYTASGATSGFVEGLLATALYLDFGRIGVELFFIISGYVIGNSLLHYRGDNVRTFVVSRVCRLYPAYVLSVALVFFLADGGQPLATYAVNLTMLQAFLGVPHVLSVYWTLAVELAFYVLCVALYLTGVLASRRRLLVLFAVLTAYTAVAAVVRATAGVPLVYGWTLYLSLMVGGTILRHLDNAGRAKDGRFWGAVAAYVLVVAAASHFVAVDPALGSLSWHQEFGAFACALALFFGLAYLYRPRARAVAYLGLISYSIYLFHAPVGHLVLRLLAAGGLAQRLPLGLSIAVVFGGAVLFAALSYHAVERPGIRAGRRLVARLQRAAPAAAGVAVAAPCAPSEPGSSPGPAR